MTPEELQRLEICPALRIKFASIRDDGSLASDASSDYGPFFAALTAERTDWVPSLAAALTVVMWLAKLPLC